MIYSKKTSVLASLIGVLLITGLAGMYLSGCLKDATGVQEDDVSMVVEWNRLILRSEAVCEGYRGAVAARAYGYIGLAAYEAALPGLAGQFKSLNSFYPGMDLPDAPDPSKYDRRIALNACYAAMLHKFYLVAPDPIRQENVGLEKKWEACFVQDLDTATVSQSRRFGRAIADAVYAWSATDTLGFEANHHNYERTYIPPEGEGLWKTSADFPMPPLLPYWGKVRPFVIHTEAYLAKPIPPFSAETNQAYYRQAVEIISLSSPMSPENQWIGEFWNDDHPGMMFSPPGHWLAITNQVIEKEHPSLEKTLETYLKVGFALSDALVATFYSKYLYNLERPETFIQEHIDKSWRPYAPSPSFPAYPSGHAMIGAAAATVLTSMFGPNYHMMDCSHEKLENVKVKPREFNSFDQMARENALSRIIIGVHWRMDMDEGLRLGELIGKEVSELQIENKLTE